MRKQSNNNHSIEFYQNALIEWQNDNSSEVQIKIDKLIKMLEYEQAKIDKMQGI